MLGNRFTHLGQAELRALEMLETPIYVYGFASQNIVWANESAIRFWNAENLAELQKRELTPYSEATSRRLGDYLAAFRNGEKRTESWTYYPKGVAVSAMAHCSGVSLEGHEEAILVEIKSLDPDDLPDSELRAIEALRHTPAMVWMFSGNGALLLRNPAATAFFTHSDDGMSVSSDGMKALRAMFEQPEDFDRLMAELDEAGYASRTVKTNRSAAPHHSVQLTRIPDPATGDPAILWFQQDVSQLREMTLQLAASESALDIVLGLSGAPSLLLDVSGERLLKANLAARNTLQLDLDSIGNGAAFFADEAVRCSFLAAVGDQGSHSATARLVAPGGRTFWAAILGTRLISDGEPAVLVIISDIDEMHKVAVDLEVALNLERGVSEMQRRMLEIASHEFRTPLAVIDGAAQRIVRRSQDMPQEQLIELAERIRCFVSGLNALLDRTIERARKNLVGVQCERIKGSIQQAIAEVRSSFAYLADISIDEGIQFLPELWFDASLFKQALVNLIENAIKYSSGAPRISVSASVEAGLLKIYIRDWGIGILPEDRERVFVERARGSNVGDLPGSGLGLFIVRGIFRAHGGDAAVVDTNGPGTTIRLVLPLGEPAEGAASS